MNFARRLAHALVPVLMASASLAEVHTFDVCCRSAQEVPPQATSGEALLTVTVDDVANTVQVSGTFQNLMGDISFAVMHGPALPDELGPGMMSLSVTGDTSGTVSGSSTLAASAVQTILDGLAYIDLHTAFAPGGEVRGQVANNGETYCPASPNSAGPGAVLRITGCRTLADQDVRLHVSGLPANVPGLFFFGPIQLNLPFGDGVRCAGGAVQRVYPFVFADGAGYAERSLNFGAVYAGFLTAGSRQNFQLWYRDMAAGGSGHNTSSGVALDML